MPKSGPNPVSVSYTHLDVYKRQVSGLDEEEAYHLVLLAGGDDGEILVLAEHALSGAQRFRCV